MSVSRRTALVLAAALAVTGQDGVIAQVRKDSLSQPHPLTDEIFAVTADGVRVATASDFR